MNKKKTAKKKTTKKKTALARRQPVLPTDTTPMGIMQRMARDPKLTVEKLERLIALNERLMDRTASSEFTAAYDAMVLELPTISKRGKILNREGKVQSHYAKFEDIQRVVKPILKRFGFTLSYRTEWPESTVLEVVGVLTHVGGHSRESRFRSPADASGGKNAIQGLGSANAYGRRYTTIDLLNLVTEGVDDDGKGAGKIEPKKPPTVPPAGQEPPAAHHASAGEKITDPQRKRLFAIMKTAGRNHEDLKAWLKARYKLDSTQDILRSQYDEVCKAVEAKGELPTREPGE